MRALFWSPFLPLLALSPSFSPKRIAGRHQQQQQHQQPYFFLIAAAASHKVILHSACLHARCRFGGTAGESVGSRLGTDQCRARDPRSTSWTEPRREWHTMADRQHLTRVIRRDASLGKLFVLYDVCGWHRKASLWLATENPQAGVHQVIPLLVLPTPTKESDVRSLCCCCCCPFSSLLLFFLGCLHLLRRTGFA